MTKHMDTPRRLPSGGFESGQWFKNAWTAKWHLHLRYFYDHVTAACGASGYTDGHKAVDGVVMTLHSPSPPPQACCLNCLRQLSRLPLGEFPDDRALVKADEEFAPVMPVNPSLRTNRLARGERPE